MPDPSNPGEGGVALPASEASGKPTPVSRSRGPGVVTIAAHFPEAVRRQLRIIAAQEGRTSQSLLGEALNDLFRKRGQLPIAPE